MTVSSYPYLGILPRSFPTTPVGTSPGTTPVVQYCTVGITVLVRVLYYLQDLEEQKRTKYKINGTVLVWGTGGCVLVRVLVPGVYPGFTI